MLRPVGPLPAAVYWRRRLLVLTLLLSVVGGGGWLGVTQLGRRPAERPLAAAAATSSRTAASPALEKVLPEVAGVQTPTVAAASAATTSAPAAGGPCSDAMLSLQVQAPAAAAVGATATFQLVVTDTSPVGCARPLDAGLREIILLDAAGDRVWSSADCAAESTPDPRTLTPGEPVGLPVTWSGQTSEPTCTAARATPPAGAYTLRGRLDTLTSPDVPFTLS